MQVPFFVRTMSAMLLAVSVNGRWQPGIGDPTPMGWATTLCYFVAALLCFRATWQAYRIPPAKLGGRAMVFWAICGLLMLFLCVNKQLDLQSLFTQIGRDWSKADGWYEGRLTVQKWFIRGMAGVGLLGIVLAAWFIRGASLAYYFAVVGMVFTGCFVIVRAASMHHVDVLLGYQVAGVKMNWVFE
ncbi:MAG: hypothetical protein L3K26_19580, partial [Candidatus Hydrogenedentes bacterium]|nr:hypothetical protein [Candidatus Hydrogenedentota bacterium]